MSTGFWEYLRQLDTEWPTLFVILSVSIYMVIGARDFSNASSQFPQMTGGIVIVLGAIVVLSKIFDFELPGASATRIGSSEELEELEEIRTDEATEEASRDSTMASFKEDFEDLSILSALVVVYAILALSTGLILSSFIFVILYSAVWKRMEWYAVLVLMAATFVFSWMFQSQLSIDMNQTYFDTGFDFGQYWDMLPITLEAQTKFIGLIMDVSMGVV